MKKITDSWLKDWRFRKKAPGEKGNPNEVTDAACTGLLCNISTRNQISFRVRKRLGKGLKRKPGVLPNKFRVGAYGIEQARRDAYALIDKWMDEVNGKKTLTTDEIPTFAQLVEEYEKARDSGDMLASRDGRPLPKAWKKNRKAILAIYSPLADRKVHTITRNELNDAHNAYLQRREAKTGRRPVKMLASTFKTAKPMLTFAVNKGWLPAESIAGLRVASGKKKGRKRTILPGEWQQIGPVLRTMPNLIGILPLFLIMTCCRIGMAISMKWAHLREVDVGTDEEPRMMTFWYVPKEDMKMEYLAIIPIVGESARILDMLREAKKPDQEYVFPYNVRRAWKINRTAFQKKINKATGTSKWHRHDCRRTGITYLQSVGATIEQVVKALAHRREEDTNSAATESTWTYARFRDNISLFTSLADSYIKMHAMLADIEAGKLSPAVARLQRAQSIDEDIESFCADMQIDREKWARITPAIEHMATVHELRPQQSA